MRGRSTVSARPRGGIVAQRYGQDVVGSVEAHARMLAMRLAIDADVTVFTTFTSGSARVYHRGRVVR